MNKENLSADKKDIRLKITNHMSSLYGLNDDQIENLLVTAKKIEVSAGGNLEIDFEGLLSQLNKDIADLLVI